MPINPTAWETSAELEFISKLGKHSEHRFDHDELVLEYFNACRKRVDWGNIDRSAITKRCMQELSKA